MATQCERVAIQITPAKLLTCVPETFIPVSTYKPSRDPARHCLTTEYYTTIVIPARGAHSLPKFHGLLLGHKVENGFLPEGRVHFNRPLAAFCKLAVSPG
jgi:hypothetical protein